MKSKEFCWLLLLWGMFINCLEVRKNEVESSFYRLEFIILYGWVIFEFFGIVVLDFIDVFEDSVLFRGKLFYKFDVVKKSVLVFYILNFVYLGSCEFFLEDV